MKSSPLPGTVLAMLDTRLEMFVDVACDPDAYACERKVVLPLLGNLKKGGPLSGRSKFVRRSADRPFCEGGVVFHPAASWTQSAVA
jgi:hypothetical protein